MKREQDLLRLKSIRGVLLYLPRRSPWELQRIEQRKRRALRAFAIGCIAGAMVILAWLMVGGR